MPDLAQGLVSKFTTDNAQGLTQGRQQAGGVPASTNTAPAITMQSTAFIAHGVDEVVSWSATDAEGDGMTATLQGQPPPWVTLNSNAQVGSTIDGNITCNPPPYVATGDYTVTLRVTDDDPGDPKFDESVITVTVSRLAAFQQSGDDVVIDLAYYHSLDENSTGRGNWELVNDNSHFTFAGDGVVVISDTTLIQNTLGWRVAGSLRIDNDGTGNVVVLRSNADEMTLRFMSDDTVDVIINGVAHTFSASMTWEDKIGQAVPFDLRWDPTEGAATEGRVYLTYGSVSEDQLLTGGTWTDAATTFNFTRTDTAQLEGALWDVHYYDEDGALVHQWDFDEGTGTTVTDSVGSSNGTLTAGTGAWDTDPASVGYFMKSSSDATVEAYRGGPFINVLVDLTKEGLNDYGLVIRSGGNDDFVAGQDTFYWRMVGDTMEASTALALAVDGSWDWNAYDATREATGVGPGLKNLKLYKSERLVGVDRIILTANSSYTTPTPDSNISQTPATRTFNPVIDKIGDQAYNEGDDVLISINANSLPGDSLTVEVSSLPARLTYTETTNTGDNVQGEISGTWIGGDAGTYSNIKITATDDSTYARSASETIEMVVSAINVAPTLATIADHVAREGAAQSTISLSATDPESDALTYTAFDITGGTEVALPTWAVLNQDPQIGDTRTGNIAVNTSAGDAGSYTFIVYVTDDGTPNEQDFQQFDVTINANTAPVVTVDEAATVIHDNDTVLNWSATDADGDSMTASLTGSPPAWVTVQDNGDGTGTVTANPPANIASSDFTATLRITDDGPIAETTDTVITFTVTRNAVFQQSGDDVVIDMAHYFALNENGTGTTWALENDEDADPANDDYSMVSPSGGSYAWQAGPYMDFNVNFTKSGSNSYSVVYRMGGNSGWILGADSFYWEIVGETMESTSSVTKAIDGTWQWYGYESAREATGVGTGLKTIRIYMRENFVGLDRIIVTANSSYTTPTGLGPAESTRTFAVGAQPTSHIPPLHIPEPHYPGEQNP